MFFTHKKGLKMYYATKVKTLLYVSSFVQLFTVFEEAVLKLVSALKSKMATISRETKHGEKIYFVFSPYFFILIIINVQLYNEMSGLKNEQHSFSTSTSRRNRYRTCCNIRCVLCTKLILPEYLTDRLMRPVLQ